MKVFPPPPLAAVVVVVVGAAVIVVVVAVVDGTVLVGALVDSGALAVAVVAGEAVLVLEQAPAPSTNAEAVAARSNGLAVTDDRPDRDQSRVGTAPPCALSSLPPSAG